MTQFWKWVKNEVSSSGSDLVLEGVVASESWYGDEVTPKAFREELEKHKGDLTVVINSPGGDVYSGIYIYNELKNHEGNVTVRINGLAASIASVIAMAGDKVIMGQGSLMMVHQPMVGSFGNADEMRETAEYLDKVGDQLIDIYQSKTGLDRERIVEMLKAETWLDGTEAVELGFADEAPGAGNLSNAVKNVLDYINPVKAAVSQPLASLQAKLVEEANATDTTPSVDEAVEQAVETETPVEADEQSEAETTEAQEVTEPVAEQTKQPVEKEIKAMSKEIAETQVLEPKAQASVDATPKVDAKAWFKSKDAVEAFTMALADNAGKDFRSEEVQAAYKAAQVKAGITDPSVFTLPEPVVTSIEDAVKSGEIYGRMNHTGLDVFKLVWDDADSEADTSRAGGFNPAYESGGDVDRTKEQQILDFENRVIRAQ